jgi:hypothetical protein
MDVFENKDASALGTHGRYCGDKARKKFGTAERHAARCLDAGALRHELRDRALH